MASYLEINNDKNSVQVDDLWANYALVSRVDRVAVRNSWRGGEFIGTILTWPTQTDLIFIHCEQDFYPVYNQITGPDTPRDFAVGTPTVGTPITFYIFRRQQPAQSKMGLQCFSASGELLFDADSKFARVISVIPPLNGSTIEYPTAPGRKLAVMIPSMYGRIVREGVQIGSPEAPWYMHVIQYAPTMRFEPTKMVTGPFRMYSVIDFPWQSKPPNSATTNLGQDMLIADVTGY